MFQQQKADINPSKSTFGRTETCAVMKVILREHSSREASIQEMAIHPFTLHPIP